MKITKLQYKQILKEEFKKVGLLKEHKEATMISNQGLETLLGKLLAQLKKLDLSIDYLSSAFTGEDPLSIGLSQGALGRFVGRPTGYRGSKAGTKAVVAEQKQEGTTQRERKTRITKARIKQLIQEEIAKVAEGNFEEEYQSPRQVFFEVIIPALEAAGYTGLDAMKVARDAVDAAFEAGAEMIGPPE